MSKNYHKLILQVSLKKFSFVIKNLSANEVTHFASEAICHDTPIEEQLDKIFQKHPELSETYTEIVVLHDNTLNTFIPRELFDEESMGHYLQYATKVFSTDFFAYDEVDSSPLNNVYVPYVNINNYLIDKFGSFTYQNSNTLLIESLLNKTKQTEQKEAFAYIQKDHFELVVLLDGELIFFNSFQHQTTEDFIYYILFTYEQLGLSTEDTPLHLMGRIEEQDPYYEQAYAYIRHLYLLESNFVINENLLLHHQVPKQHYILFHS